MGVPRGYGCRLRRGSGFPHSLSRRRPPIPARREELRQSLQSLTRRAVSGKLVFVRDYSSTLRMK